MPFRQRYFLIVSAGFIVLGLIIVGRAIAVSNLVPAIFGIILIALGGIRLRDFLRIRGGIGSRGP